jgi:hypothetical protein
MQGARWWRETTSESTNTNAIKKKKKVEKMGNKTRRRTLHTHSNITQQQEPHTKWQKYISFISSVIVTPSVYLSVFCVRT